MFNTSMVFLKKKIHTIYKKKFLAMTLWALSKASVTRLTMPCKGITHIVLLYTVYNTVLSLLDTELLFDGWGVPSLLFSNGKV